MQLADGVLSVLIRIFIRHHVQEMIISLHHIAVKDHKRRIKIPESKKELIIAYRYNAPVSTKIISGDPLILVHHNRIQAVYHMRGSKDQHIRTL